MGALDGRTALVTGGSRGIGRAIVQRLAADGASVMFSFLHDEQAAGEALAAVSSVRGRAFAVRADQGSLDDLDRLFDEATQHLGSLDILVNNAAIGGAALIGDVTEADFDRVFAVNARGPFFAIQRAGKALNDNGRIVNISSMDTVLPVPGIALYAGSKGALEQFTAVAAREFGPRGITVNCVSPGATDTDMLRSANSPEALEQAVEQTALGRLGRPADVAAVVAFLAGPDSGWVTGQNLRASGGFVL